MAILEAADHPDIFTSHAFPEQTADRGEIRMNYATAGDAGRPALVLVPGQSASWWSYQDAILLLAEQFRVYAVDLRGQGRSTWTPGRYTLDNMGNDLVRFLDLIVGRAAIVSGNSSGGLLAAWLAAFAKPGQLRGAVLEDAPVFAAEVTPSCGPSIRQAIGPVFARWNKWLGDQWTIGDWAGMQAAMPTETPPWLPAALASARAPVLYTHHYRAADPASGALMGAASDQQVARARELVTAAGQSFEVVSLPGMAHAVHEQDPQLFASLLTEWAQKLDPR